MLNRRKLWLVLALAAAMAFIMSMGAVPSAEADACTVKITLLGGQTLTFNVNVPPGTPISDMKLPITGVVVAESESCVPSSSSSTSTGTSTSSSGSTSSGSTSSSSSSSSTSTSTSSSTTTSSSSTATTPQPVKPGKPQTKSSRPQKKDKSSAAPGSPKRKKKKKSKPAGPTGRGVPAASDPSFSLSLPGPVPLGVPNFFIDSFRIPPFLIPIYQAAGIEYQVPWQVLAAVNEIETDYGRNLSVSSAGAVGWMQFLPSTWRVWGVDANGDGVADPYNPVDAVFTAARYLHAAGASRSLSAAVFAYNHASWYVQSVLLRARLIGGIPSQLVGALTGLVQGHFPVAAPAKYADGGVLRLAGRRVRGSNAAVAVDSGASRGTQIFARRGSPVIAVNDGRIVRVGDSRGLGRFVVLQDQTGNVYTYAHLGSVTARYPVPKPVRVSAAEIARELAVPVLRAPAAPASAGQQSAALAAGGLPTRPDTGIAPAAPQPKTGGAISLPLTPAAPATRTARASRSGRGGRGFGAARSAGGSGAGVSVAAPLVKERLFARPSRSASFAAGGALQLRSAGGEIHSFENYFSDVLHLGRDQYRLQALKPGAIVIAGTILGRIGGPSQHVSPHLYFTIQPAGRKAPLIDPKPILDGWKLLEATAVYRAAGIDPFFGPGARNPTIGQVLLMSKTQLTARVLQDPHIQLGNCARRDIATGLTDRRILAITEFLVASGLDPTITGLPCNPHTPTNTAAESTIQITKINNIPIEHHQQTGSITDITIRRLLTLQGAMRPDQIISTIAYKAQPNTLALPDHPNHIEITYTPDYGTNPKLSHQIKTILQPGQWIHLINRISQIPEPIVPITPSKYAIRTHQH